MISETEAVQQLGHERTAGLLAQRIFDDALDRAGIFARLLGGHAYRGGACFAAAASAVSVSNGGVPHSMSQTMPANEYMSGFSVSTSSRSCSSDGISVGRSAPARRITLKRDCPKERLMFVQPATSGAV